MYIGVVGCCVRGVRCGGGCNMRICLAFVVSRPGVRYGFVLVAVVLVAVAQAVVLVLVDGGVVVIGVASVAPVTAPVERPPRAYP